MRSLADRVAQEAVKRRAAAQAQPEIAALTPCDSLLRSFEELSRRLERPYSTAEIKAAAPPGEAGMTLGCLMLAAGRLGFKAKEVKPTQRNLAQLPVPFILIGERPGEGWLVKSRVKDHLVVWAAASGQSSALSLGTAAEMATRAVLLRPLPQDDRQASWREGIMRRLRPVLWEVGLASVIINLLALATPIFLMTVYNTVEEGSWSSLPVLQRPVSG